MGGRKRDREVGWGVLGGGGGGGILILPIDCRTLNILRSSLLLPNDDDELMLNVLRCHLTY